MRTRRAWKKQRLARKQLPSSAPFAPADRSDPLILWGQNRGWLDRLDLGGGGSGKLRSVGSVAQSAGALDQLAGADSLQRYQRLPRAAECPTKHSQSRIAITQRPLSSAEAATPGRSTAPNGFFRSQGHREHHLVIGLSASSLRSRSAGLSGRRHQSPTQSRVRCPARGTESGPVSTFSQPPHYTAYGI